MPTVSIIIPVFNRIRFLRPAIESALAQSFTDWEMIVADDGSNDETREYLRGIAGPRVQVLWLSHTGNPSAVRNAAAAAACGRYLAFLDSDDEWAPEKLQRQIAALRARPNCRWSYTACRHIDGIGQVIAKKHASAAIAPEGWIFKQLLTLEIGIAMPTVIAQRDLFDEAGGFDEQQRFGEFHDLCLRLALKGEVVVVRETLCSVRVHNEHYSSNRTEDHAGWLQLYRKMSRVTEGSELHAHCLRMQAESSLRLSSAHAEQGDYRAACAELGRALPFSWPYPRWWWGALKRIVRPAIPTILVTILRKRRAR